MGFGIMFIGYFITFVGALVIPLAPYTYVLGAGVLLYSLRKLVVENKMFLTTAIYTICFEILSLGVLVFDMFFANSIICDILTSIQMVAGPVLNVLLLISILLISKQVGATKIQSGAIVNLVVTVITLIFILLSVFITASDLAARCYLVGYVGCIIYTIFTLITVFRCYANICYEDDVNMEKETTGFKLLDTLNKWLNKANNKNKEQTKESEETTDSTEEGAENK